MNENENTAMIASASISISAYGPPGGSVSPIFVVEKRKPNVNANAPMTATTSTSISACGTPWVLSQVCPKDKEHNEKQKNFRRGADYLLVNLLIQFITNLHVFGNIDSGNASAHQTSLGKGVHPRGSYGASAWPRLA